MVGLIPYFGEPVPFFQTDSPLEIDFWLEWHAQGYHWLYSLSPQYPFKGGRYYIDFAYPPLNVGIELDGYNYHSDRAAFTRDRKRQREMETLGWHFIRFSRDELCWDLLLCIEEVMHFLEMHKHRRLT
jgi:very-short-patch-repair endonuclease